MWYRKWLRAVPCVGLLHMHMLMHRTVVAHRSNPGTQWHVVSARITRGSMCRSRTQCPSQRDARSSSMSQSGSLKAMLGGGLRALSVPFLVPSRLSWCCQNIQAWKYDSCLCFLMLRAPPGRLRASLGPPPPLGGDIGALCHWLCPLFFSFS